MMAEYLTLEQAAEAFAIQTVFSTSDCLDMLYYAIQKGWISPSNVAPVVHGRWIVRNKGMNNWVDCSECGTIGSPHWKCCPVCEAKMDFEG